MERCNGSADKLSNMLCYFAFGKSRFAPPAIIHMHVPPQLQAMHEAEAALVELGRFLKAEGYRFTTVSPLTHSRVNARKGNECATDLEGIFGWSRPFDIAAVPEDLCLRMRNAGVLVREGSRYRSLVRASTLGGQLFFHSAYPTAEVDAVFFGPDTYRFVNAVEQYLAGLRTPVRRAVDIGCGGGPGAISIASLRTSAEVYAVDINPKAIRFAEANSRLAGTQGVHAMQGDLLNDIEGTFDLVVANPPYLIDADQRTYRHGAGSLGEGLSLAIVDAAVKRLSDEGSLLLYTGVAIVNGKDSFRDAIEEKFKDSRMRWEYREIDPDIFGEELMHEPYTQADRIAAVVLAATKEG